MSTKSIKAPPGFHFMKTKSGVKLMKHTGKFQAHAGASKTFKLKVVKSHGAKKKSKKS